MYFSIIAKAIGNNGTVSSTGGLTYTGCHPLFYFKDFCAVADGSLIRKLTTGFVLSSGIDLGGDWKATLKMTNIGNDYLVIPASRGYGNDFVFLWNGISSTYQYALEVPGKVLGVQTVKGRLYIAVRNTANRCVIYLQKGKQLEIVTHPLLNFNGSIAKDGLSLFHGSSLLVSTTAGSFIYGDSFVGVYSTNQYNRYCIGNDSYTYGSVTATQAVYKFDDQVTTHNPIVYISKWIPLSGKLSAINIYYDTPPTSASDTISVSLDSWGENQYTGVTNIPLTTITNTNYTTTKRTILDVKDFTGDLCRINLQTTSNVPSTWQPIIRKIELIVQ